MPYNMIEKIYSNLLKLFYKSLYTQPVVDKTKTEAFLDLITLPKVGDNQSEDVIREITDEEIKKAISNLKPNKGAGPDGFPSEWYKEMKELLIPRIHTTMLLRRE